MLIAPRPESFWHRVEHLFGWNPGRVWSITDREGNHWIGFRCTVCGDVNHVHQPPEDLES